MPYTNENERVERVVHSGYDVRIATIESRIGVVEVDVAVMRNSFATKDDVQRILTLLYEHKLEFQAAMAKQRDEVNASIAKTQVDLHKALTNQTWKLYGLASLMVAGVYFIARYVH